MGWLRAEISRLSSVRAKRTLIGEASAHRGGVAIHQLLLPIRRSVFGPALSGRTAPYRGRSY